MMRNIPLVAFKSALTCGRVKMKSFMLAVGGALFGAFVSGFVTELSTGHSKLLLAVYVMMGVFGMILIFAGLQD